MRLKRFVATTAAGLIALIGGLGLSSTASAQSAKVPNDSAFVLQLDLEKFRKTEIGSKLVDLTLETAAAELDGEGDEALAKLHEALGFNPIEEIRSLTVAISNLENPQDAVSAIIQMGKTTGNLEGLLLSLPNYASEELDGQTLHSFGDGGRNSAVGTIVSGRNNNKSLVIAPSKANLLDVLNSENGISVSDMSDGAFLVAELFEIPEALSDTGPFEAVAGLLKSARLTVTDSGDDLEVVLRAEAVSEKKAEQIKELVQGLRALSGIFMDSVDELQDEEIRDVAQGIVNSLDIQLDGASVSIGIEVPNDMILEFLREEADLAL